MSVQSALNEVINGGDLPGDVMRAVMHDMMSGKMTDAQIGGFLVALRMKGETIEGNQRGGCGHAGICNQGRH